MWIRCRITSFTLSSLQRGAAQLWAQLSPGSGCSSGRSSPSPAAAHRCSPRRWRHTPRCRSSGRPHRSRLSSGWPRERRPECCGAARSPLRTGPAGSLYTGSRPRGCSGGTGPGRRRSWKSEDNRVRFSSSYDLLPLLKCMVESQKTSNLLI